MLKLSHVKKTFNRGTVTEKRALTGVDLTLADGDFVTVIGGNGAGKSTLLDMIAGVYPLDSGTVELDGEDISRLSEPKRAKYLGRVFQDPMRGTAADMQMRRTSPSPSAAASAVRFAGASPAPSARSTPSCSKSSIWASRPACRPRWACCPVASARHSRCSWPRSPTRTCCCSTSTPRRSTPRTAAKVLELTEQIVGERKLTTLMVTHNMNDAIRLGNRLIMMHEGRVIYDVAGDEKRALTVPDLLQKFEEVSGGQLADDPACC